eukprot:4955153-Pyramimonas_sp.AAC.1
MQGVRRDSAREALGDLPASNAEVMGVADWAPGPRQRTWLASFPPSQPDDLRATWGIAPRWGPRLAFRGDGIVPALARSRGGPGE